MNSKTILFLAPGQSMGHAVRAASLAWYIKEAGHRPVIFYDWDQYNAAAAFLNKMNIEYQIFGKDTWAEDLHNQVTCLDPDLIVTMEFPFGKKGEFTDLTSWPVIHIARHLKWEEYMLRIQQNVNSPQCQALLNDVVAIDHLSETQESLYRHYATNFMEPKGWLLFPSEALPDEVPGWASRLLSHPSSHLIIHNGPEKELQLLYDRAKSTATQYMAPVLIVCPVMPKFLMTALTQPVTVRWLSYFPARHLINKATWVYTAAGINALGECSRVRPDRHIAVPMKRAYDDQEVRYKIERAPQMATLAAGQKPKLSCRSTSAIARHLIKKVETREDQ